MANGDDIFGTMNAKVARLTRTAVFLSVPVIFSGCLKPEEFPDEPLLTFKSLEQKFETVTNDPQPERFIYITVGFTDGDGDIGLDDTDVQSPFGQDEAHYYNFQCEFKQRIGGQWTDVNSNWRYRMKRISPSGQDPTLNGEITVKVGPYPGPRLFPDPDILVGDTLQATIRLEDRSLHMSNTVTSEAFVLQ
jgi:hypothetical protein